MDSPINEISIEDRLREVYEKTDSREYAEALDVLENARAADPENIYIAALKRQLDALLSRSQADELGEDQRHELMEPMPGIIECAIRDHHRQNRSSVSNAPPVLQKGVAPEGEAEPRSVAAESGHGADPGEVQKELEALKLLYFQRASKFVMKGEYEQALAEVRRVFVVDPENTIAKEYASRVEHLIQHARRLASEPMPSGGGTQEGPGTPGADPAPEAGGSSHVHNERSTAWDEDFVAPKSSQTVPDRRAAHPSSRQTVAYGDSLAVSLSPVRNGEEYEDEEKPGKKKSKLVLVLATVILTPLLAGVAVAIFSTKSPAPSGRNDAAAKQAQVQDPAAPFAASIGAAQSRTPEETVPRKPEHQDVTNAPAPKSVPAPAEQKVISEQSPAAAEAGPQSKPSEVPAAGEPVKLSAPVAENAPPPQPKAPAVEQPKAATEAFVAVEKDPQIVRLEKPEFPGFVWKMGGEGQVVVRVLIDANGKPLDSQILKSTNPVFEQPVIDAVMKSQFNPAQMGQGPVAAWLTIPFKFRQPK